MPRPRTGYVEWQGDDATGRWRTRVPDGKGGREWVHLPAELRRADKARAQRVALRAQIEAERAPRPTAPEPVPAGETVREYLPRWTAERVAAGRTNASLDAATLGRWLLPILGDRPMRSVTRTDLEGVVDHLDATVRTGKLSWKTAVNVWGLARKLFGDAASSKRIALRILDASPARDVAGPDRGREKQKQFLWPSELTALVACEAVPLAWRRVYACAVYLGARAGELNALRARDVDRVRWVVSIAEAMSTRGSPAKSSRRAPKTQAGTRSFSVEPAARPLLDVLCREAPTPDARLVRAFRTDGPDGATSYLQRHLRVAGVTREELLATTATRKRVTFHDLRATFCTWSAIRGDEPVRIMHRAGHEDLETTMGYVRAAEVLDRDAVGEVFPPLPRVLLEGGLDLRMDRPSPGAAGSSRIPAESAASPEGFEFAPRPALPDEHPRSPAESGGAPGAHGSTEGAEGAAVHSQVHSPDDALRAAARVALDAGDDDLAAELLALLRTRGAHLRRVG